MKERLVIKNFGPIKSIDLELGKMTILIGEQATGKSTIAKVLAVCRYFSYLVTAIATKDAVENYNNPFTEGLRQWNLLDFVKNGTEIMYENETYSLSGIGFEGNATILNEKTNDVVDNKKLFFLNVDGKKKEFSYLFDTIELFKENSKLGVFTQIPSSFYQNEVSKVMNNPFYFPTERGLQSIFSLGKSSMQNISDSLFNQFAKMDMFSKNFKSETEIKPLDLIYKNENGQGFIKNQRQEEFSSIYNGASGYQSTIPVVLAIKYYTEIKKKKKTFIIEEPELNLFPKAQKKLMEFFVENINNNEHSFLLPTHSPYILSSIENLMYAYKIGHLDNGIHKEKVNSIVNENYWMNPEDVSVYYLNDGIAIDILDKKQALIDKDYIDSVSKIINNEFDNLLNIEVEYEH